MQGVLTTLMKSTMSFARQQVLNMKNQRQFHAENEKSSTNANDEIKILDNSAKASAPQISSSYQTSTISSTTMIDDQCFSKANLKLHHL